MIGKMLNLPFKVIGGVARAVQASESKKWADLAAKDAASAKANKSMDISVPADFDPGPIHVELAAAMTALKDGCVVDVSDIPAPIEGVLSIPLKQVGIRIAELPPSATVVVIADDPSKSDEVVRFLRHRGLDETWSLTGGTAPWVAALNTPGETGK